MKLGLIISSLLYFVTLMLMGNQGCNGCLEKERIALLEIKHYFLEIKKGDQGCNGSLLCFVPDNDLASWVDDRDSNCCSWNRVKCSNTSSGHITELFFYDLLGYSQGSMVSTTSNHFPGLTPLHMLNVSLFRPFEELRFLDLSGNMFGGWIGNEGFPRLTKLETLDLSDNYLNSSILPSLNGLTALTTLKLGYNLMENFSAQGFLRSKELKVLDLSNNGPNCNIITSLHGFTSLRSLILRDNDFNCSLSTLDVQHLRNLKMLSLENNQMNGSIEGLCKLKDLVELNISDNMFGDKLPECLSNLTNLRVLDLSNNLFNGDFPSFISNLTSLTYLSFYGNYMQGSFSLSTLANHSNLHHLYISSQSIGAHVETERTKWFPKFQLKSLILTNCNLNKDKGRVVPSFLSYQYNLILVDLSRNKIVGSFPSWLMHKHNNDIQYLDISNNNFSGLLPEDIGIFLPKVTYLNFSWNSFEGNIPSSIGNITELQILDLSHNHFSGELSEQWGYFLVYLKLSNNSLRGNIPKFSNLVNVEVLFLNNNNFSGTLEDVFENNTRLASVFNLLSISNNLITGKIPSSIGMFSNMQVLLMSGNLLEGEIPIEISNMSWLQILDLSQNKLNGSIPKFSWFKHLRFLYLQQNDLSGSMPSELSKGSQLQLLDLRENKFSGKIPNWMDKLSELRVLLLGGNNFEGEIPIQLCLLNKIDIMDLSRNMLNASIPSCFRNMSFGMRQYVDDDYDDDGRIFEFSLFINSSFAIYSPLEEYQSLEDLQLEVEFRTKHNEYFYKGKVLENMTGLDLSCNKLTGVIPSQIGHLQQVRALNLSHNHLSGLIPITFSNLAQIESLDLSYNNLSGKIPYELTQLNFLSTFNVSYNNLSGTPPSTGQFGGFDEDNYRGNPGLCGPLLNRKCEGVTSSPSSQSNDNGEKETIVDMITFYWSFTASYITILLAFVTVLCINARWRMAWFYYISKVIRRFFPTFPLY